MDIVYDLFSKTSHISYGLSYSLDARLDFWP